MKSFDLGELSQRKKKPQTLSLVALMDIFTVLVFFLMFNVHSEQAVNTKHVTNIPDSVLALDQLKQDERVEVLEVPNREIVYLNDERIVIDDALDALSVRLDEHCQVQEEGCAFLAIQAPEDMDYTFVNRFVEMGSRLGIENIYLVVKQKH